MRQTDLIDRARHMVEANLHLQADVERLKTLFLKAPSVMAVLNGPRHVFEFVNQAMVELLGPRDYLGRPVREALAELAGQRLFEVLDTVYATGREYLAYDVPIRVKRGPAGELERRTINVIYQPILEDGAVAGIFAVGTDITEQHLARRMVEMQVAQLKQVERQQVFQLALADRLAPLGAVEEIIGAASALLGETLGVTRVLFAEVHEPAGLVRVRRDWCVADVDSVAGLEGTLEEFGPGMARELRAGCDVVVDDVALDPRTREGLRVYRQVGVGAHVTLPLIKSEELRIVLSMHSATPRAWSADEVRMAREMAERTWAAVETARAQAELRAERDQSQYIFDSMTEGFALLDTNWIITRMNGAGLQLVQRQESEIVGHDHWVVFPNAVGSEVERICRQVMGTRTAGQVEYAYPLPAGGHQWMEVRVYPAMDGGLAIFFRDITKRRSAEEQLRLEAQRKDEFLAMLAHELRNPLAPIGAAAELLRSGGSPATGCAIPARSSRARSAT